MSIKEQIKKLISYKTIAFYDAIALIIAFIFSGVLLVDELEHLHAAYFINSGLIPFRDFFEHHHPLFWFLLVPFIEILPQNALIVLFSARLLMTVISTCTFYYIYKIAKHFLGGKLCALLTVLIFLSFYPTIYMFSMVKPGTVMRFFFVCGLYYFFEYTQTLKGKPLVISFTAFILSFLFLQTAIFLIFPIILIALYILSKNPKQIINFIYASILPLLFIGMFIAYLYTTDSLKIYWQSCWIFNTKFFNLLDFRVPLMLPDFIIYIIFGYIAYGYVIYKGKVDFYVHTIAFLLSCSLIKNIFYPVYYPHYLLPCFFYTSFLIAYALKNAHQTVHVYLKLSLIAIFSINIAITLSIYSNVLSLQHLSRIKPTDTCFNYYSKLQNIYQPKYSYYWYAPSIESVDDYLFNHNPKYDINELIKTEKFKYILFNRLAYQLTFPRPRNDTPEKFKSTYKKHIMDEKILEDYDFVGVKNIGIYKLKSNR